jgi:2-polyprenyl-6-hydroxyphenyl methylase/3-demethylubiquinone-9 3-methyltransferase
MAARSTEDSNGHVNNEFYDHLGERWYAAQDDPVAFLRAESRARNPWIINEIRRAFPGRAVSVLDVGCGAGFLSNELAREGFDVTGLDASMQSLNVGRLHDTTGRVRYEIGQAYDLPYSSGSFQVVCAMDFLEHVEDPGRVVREVARVLAPGGLFFFHTFNRNWLSWLVVIKGVEWFVKNTPPNLHSLRYFIKPQELRSLCQQNRLQVLALLGLVPKVNQMAFLRMLLTGRVSDDFKFHFTRSTRTGYAGFAMRQEQT